MTLFGLDTSLNNIYICKPCPHYEIVICKKSFWKQEVTSFVEFYLPFQVKMSLQEKIHNSVLALAVCHNVTPVSEQHQQEPMLSARIKDEDEETVLFDRAALQSSHAIKYQASSPDEVRAT